MPSAQTDAVSGYCKSDGSNGPIKFRRIHSDCPLLSVFDLGHQPGALIFHSEFYVPMSGITSLIIPYFLLSCRPAHG